MPRTRVGDSTASGQEARGSHFSWRKRARVLPAFPGYSGEPGGIGGLVRGAGRAGVPPVSASARAPRSATSAFAPSSRHSDAVRSPSDRAHAFRGVLPAGNAARPRRSGCDPLLRRRRPRSSQPAGGRAAHELSAGRAIRCRRRGDAPHPSSPGAAWRRARDRLPRTPTSRHGEPTFDPARTALFAVDNGAHRAFILGRVSVAATFA